MYAANDKRYAEMSYNNSVLIGASKPERIIKNIKVIDNVRFSKDELREINNIVL